MDERSLQGLISKLIPDEIEGLLNPSGEQQTRAVELLKTAAGQAGGEADAEINNFLNGRGALLETTRAASARGGASANSVVAEFLTSQLHLTPALARMIAPLLVSLLPGVGKQAGTSTAARPRPSGHKPAHPVKPKPSAHKPAHAAKPRPSSSSAKPANQAKPKPSASSKPKKPKASGSEKPAARPKRRSKAGEIPVDETQQ